MNKNKFKSKELACVYANIMNAKSASQGGGEAGLNYLYVANGITLTVTRYVLKPFGWKDTGTIEAPTLYNNQLFRDET